MWCVYIYMWCVYVCVCVPILYHVYSYFVLYVPTLRKKISASDSNKRNVHLPSVGLNPAQIFPLLPFHLLTQLQLFKSRPAFPTAR